MGSSNCDREIIKRSMNLIIADDSAVLLARLVEFAKRAGHNVVATCKTADEVVLLCEQHVPDLAIVDVVMPNSSPSGYANGYDAALEIRKKQTANRVLLLTSATVGERRMKELCELGIDYWAKPIREKAFVDRIAQIAAS